MISLRPLCAEDAAELFPLLAGVAENLVVDGPESEGELELALDSRVELAEAGVVRAYTIVEAASGVVMGSIHLKYDSGRAKGEMGVWLGRQFHGQGVGSEAIRQVVEQGFAELGLKRIEAQIFEGNHASRKAFENNGFVLERLDLNGVLQRGAFRDVWVLAAYNGVMSDGIEEREELRQRFEQDKLEKRDLGLDEDDVDEGEPERVDS